MRRGAGSEPGEGPGWGLAAAGLLAAFIVHNVEEITGLAGWIAARALPIVVSERQIEVAITLLTLGAALILMGTRARPGLRVFRLGSAMLAGALLANAGGHLALSALTRSVMPGTLSALVLVIPAALWLLRRLPAPRLWPGLVGAALMLPLTWGALVVAGWLTA